MWKLEPSGLHTLVVDSEGVLLRSGAKLMKHSETSQFY